MLYAVYDLDCSPVSYDFAHFLASAFEAAKDRKVHVVVCPGNNNGWRTNDHKPITDEEREWRLTHILVPLAKMCGMGITLAMSRMDAAMIVRGADVFPPEWAFNRPIQGYRTKPLNECVPLWNGLGMSASCRAKQFVSDWVETWLPGNGPLVTITLRETHTPTRNSTLEAWASAANTLVNLGHRVAIIRDTEKAGQALHGWPGMSQTCQAAAIDLDVRLALYEKATVNAGRNGGPMTLLFMANLPYLIWGVLAQPYKDEQGRQHFVPTPALMKSFGLPVGEQLHHSPHQRFLWEEDWSSDQIVTEMVAAANSLRLAA